MKSYSNDVIEIRLVSKFKSGFLHRYQTYYFDILLKGTRTRV